MAAKKTTEKKATQKKVPEKKIPEKKIPEKKIPEKKTTVKKTTQKKTAETRISETKTAEKKTADNKMTISSLYFPVLDRVAFKDAQEEKEYYLRFIDMLCLTAVNLNENNPEYSLDRVGSILPDEQLMRALEPHPAVAFAGHEEMHTVFVKLLQKSKSGIDEGISLPLSALFLSGFLNEIEILAVLLAYASASSRKYEKIFGILEGKNDESACPTTGLCIDLARMFLEEEETDRASLFCEESFLNSVLLEAVPADSSRSVMSAPVRLRPSVHNLLNLSLYDLGDLNKCAQLLLPVTPRENVIREAELEELKECYKGFIAMGGGTINIVAPEGSGKRFLVRALAAGYSSHVLSVNLSALLSFFPEVQDAFLADILVRGVISGDIIYLYDLPRDMENGLLRVFTTLQDKLPVIIAGSEEPISGSLSRVLYSGIFRMNLKETGVKEQRSLWQEAADANAVIYDKDIDIDEIVSKYTMNPGRIFAAVQNCAGVAGPEGKIGRDLLQEQIRRICAVEFGENAKRLESPFVWEDLIVEPESEKLLRQVCDRVRYKSRVNEDFGFGAKLPYGRGLSVVFYGPPGTGKTMAAQVLANTLGLDIYRIDLSQVSSKYIGETEKNLATLFEAAKNSNAILFFDEADSLFSKRTGVSSSNDRYANAETSYLLQKVEEYSGMSILATNNMQNFDAAFKRRMSFIIPIGIPDEATRAQLWKKAFPAGAPLAKDVNFKILARAVEMSGSSIKSSAISAAYLAAAEGKKISMEHISVAVDRECLKNGRTGARNDILQAMMEG
ncbi:MAG: ATP-binding protein [Lachnospiraceae bacterium]|nr:ATP-binding protein [Lachnospiraceae bacterium]